MDNICFVCDKSFSTASNLRLHARLTHNVENKVSTCRQIKCNVCSEELVSMKALLDHVESARNIAIEKETKKFDTYEAFKIWKEDVEKQTTALYVRNTGSKFNNMKKTTYFYCHRNGFYNARGDKRTIKMAGSNKINGNCPSKMKVCEDNENQVYVEFTRTHFGHGKDLGRIQITREEKDELARKLEKKIPIEIVLDEIRDSFKDKLERIQVSHVPSCRFESQSLLIFLTIESVRSIGSRSGFFQSSQFDASFSALLNDKYYILYNRNFDNSFQMKSEYGDKRSEQRSGNYLLYCSVHLNSH
ncbi:uncharacterized protein NPIL_283831 [Nephila pilipes]|uniref:C2H2-type domain-containing protein n=1 Tax=Nephila pilipes TaxID=299642 RepID=A0A8X6MMW9_NEPPI|nr:uncharacterized protein NPIL_283831 [Nephila pilipes]